MRGAIAVIVASVFVTLVPAPARAADGTDHVRVDLITDTAAVQAGKPFTVGVRFRIDPGWHIYWTNPGDSGLPTRVKLQVPVGFSVGTTAYPVPSVLTFPGPVVNYGYENEVVLLVPVTAPAALASSAAQLTAATNFLVCKDVCLPGKVSVSISLPSPAAADAATIRRWAARLPRPAGDRAAGWVVADQSTTGGNGTWTSATSIRWTSAPPADIHFVPAALDGWDLTGLTVATSGATTTIRFTVDRTDPKAAPLPRIAGLLTYAGPDGTPVGDQLNIRNGAFPANAPAGVAGK